MKLKRYENILQFAIRALEPLYKNEAQNNLLIKNIENGMKGGDTAGWFYATVEGDTACSDSESDCEFAPESEPLLIALQTPPYSMLLYAPDNKVIPESVRMIANERPDVAGVIAERVTADAYIAACGRSVKKRFEMNLLVLTTLSDIPIADGIFRKYRESDLPYLPSWTVNFVIDCGLDDRTDSEETIRARLSERIDMDEHYVLECEGKPVSMAKAGRKMTNGIVVNNVYTPPTERGKGYCTSCVYRLSEKMLNNGNKFCCLFADANNAVSNHIYRKIGYKDLCEYSDVKFA